MLNAIKRALEQSGTIRAGTDFNLNVTVSSGDTISVSVHLEDGRWYFLKLSRHDDLTRQFVRQQFAHERFPFCTIAPVANLKIGAWSIVIFHLRHHRAMQARELISGGSSRHFGQELAKFFAAQMTTKDQSPSPLGASNSWSEIRDYFSFAPQIQAYLDGTGKELWQKYWGVSQHGDFVLNNLGIAEEHLLVFDWEDYEECRLQGMDLALLSLSIIGMNPEGAMAFFRSQKAQGLACAAFSDLGGEAIGMNHQALASALPIYLIAFRYLKRNYGTAVRDRIDRILDYLLV